MKTDVLCENMGLGTVPIHSKLWWGTRTFAAHRPKASWKVAQFCKHQEKRNDEIHQCFGSFYRRCRC